MNAPQPPPGPPPRARARERGPVRIGELLPAVLAQYGISSMAKRRAKRLTKAPDTLPDALPALPRPVPREIERRPHNRKQAESLRVGDIVTVGDPDYGDWEGLIVAIDDELTTYRVREIL